MKKITFIASFVAALSLTSTAFAGGDGSCHFHGNAPAKEAVVVGCAKDQLSGLVAKSKLDASWKMATLDKTETVEGKRMKEWKLTFNNPAATNANKKTLYMFYTLSGNLIGVNFTGQ